MQLEYGVVYDALINERWERKTVGPFETWTDAASYGNVTSEVPLDFQIVECTRKGDTPFIRVGE